MSLADEYPEGLCPDCDLPIPIDVDDGEDCEVCGHVFQCPQPCTDVPCEDCLDQGRIACLPDVARI